MMNTLFCHRPQLKTGPHAVREVAVLLLILLGPVLQSVAQPVVSIPYQPDAEPDGLIGASDLLHLLGIFGQEFEPGPVLVAGTPVDDWEADCAEVVSVLDPLQDAADGTVAVLGESGWTFVTDSVDCPVTAGCTDPMYVEYDPLAMLEDGSCALHVDSVCLHPTWDGHTYDVVQFEGQCWFAENLRSTVYANGEAIPGNLSGADWEVTTAGASAVYGEGDSWCSSEHSDWDVCNDSLSLAAYGRLYNGHAVLDPRGLCPSGWRVPTGEDWFDFFVALRSVHPDGLQGYALSADTGWYLFAGLDLIGFGGSPAGFRAGSPVGDPTSPYAGRFAWAGYWDAQWWSSSTTEDGMEAWLTTVYPGFGDPSTMYPVERQPEYGLPVRCIRDLD